MPDMRRAATRLLVATLVLACFPVALSAHPLGNFTINHFARLEVGRETIRLRYVIDLAEIPTLQELQRISGALDRPPSRGELDAYLERAAQSYLNSLLLDIDGAAVPLSLTKKNLSLLPGAGGLQTMRLECDLMGQPTRGAGTIRRLRFADNNYADRAGWREIVVLPAAGVSLFDSTAYGSALTDELKSYPGDVLAAPLDERSAELSFTFGPLPAGSRPLLTREGRFAAPASRDRLGELLTLPQLTVSIALLGLLLATLLGAFHAMSPGHGKTVVAAYLIGARGTARHAAFLGLTVTITHTAGVFALGIATLMASEYVIPEKLYPYLSLGSGAIVAMLGFSLLIRRLQAIATGSAHDHVHSPAQQQGHGHHNHGHTHTHYHDHATAQHHDHDHQGHTHTHDGHTHTHLPPGADGTAVTWRSLLALGISGGLLPCPSALMVLLSAISYQRVGYGLLLVVAFSVGLASTLTAVGLAFVYAGRLLNLGGRFATMARVVPLASSLVIAIAGVLIFYGALGEAGFHLSEVFGQAIVRVK